MAKDIMFEDLQSLYRAYKNGELGGGTGTSNHAALQNLGYNYSGHTGFSPDGHTHDGLVTNGDSHDHNGGDGAQIDHANISNNGSNTHAVIDTHLSATSPHSGHENTANKNIANGYAPLDSNSKVPTVNLGGSGADNTKYLRGDQTWQVPSSGGLGYMINVQALTSSPVDSQTIYFGMLPKAPTTTANISKVYVRKAGTIKIAEMYCYSGTAGSAESWSIYIRKNNTTDYLIATLAVSANERVFSNTGLNITMSVGDYFEIKSINPLWATNPLTTIFGGYVYIE